MSALPILLALLIVGEPPPAHVRATVWVRAGDRASGTGWVVDADRRWVVTAGHVVGDRDAVDVHFLDRRLAVPVTDRRHYVADRADLGRRGLTATGRVVARRDNADLVLLALDRLPPGVPALSFAGEAPRAGHACRSVGHRHDADPMWVLTAGRVRQVGRLPDGYFSAGRRIGANVPVVLLQSPIEAGESGSAVVNDAGHVIAVVSAVVNQTPGLAVAIDLSELRSLLADARKGSAPSAGGSSSAERADARALTRATVWVRPQSTNGRASGTLIDRDRRLVLTSATAVGTEPVIDVVAPRWDLGRLVPEADAYADRLGLRLSGHCVAGMVLARDPVRDLALVELDSVPADLEPIALASAAPRLGQPIAAMGHPTGIDLLWLYAAGTVRSVGAIELDRGPAEDRPKVRASLLQLPHQGSASGGPVVNESGDLVGILASREGARQDLAFAATPDEVRTFLDGARPLWRPTSAGEWVRRGRLALRLGRTGAAAAAFRTASALTPDDPAPLAGLASAIVLAGRAADALPLVEAALGKGPDAATLAELAHVLLAADRPQRASELVRRALERDGRCAAALVARARLGSGDQATKDVAEALFIDPAGAGAYRVRAGLRDVTSKQGRRDAVADLGRVLELAPTDRDALRQRAGLYAELKEFKKAVADWSRLTELDALRVDNWVGLARARFAADDRAGVVEALRSALRVDPRRATDVFGIVRDLGRELEADDPADRRRVSDWYAAALMRLARWLEPMSDG